MGRDLKLFINILLNIYKSIYFNSTFISSGISFEKGSNLSNSSIFEVSILGSFSNRYFKYLKKI